MNRKTQRRQKQQLLRRRHAQQLFEAPVLENVVSVASTPSATTPGLSREQQRLLTQLGELAADVTKVFHRASLKCMIEGLKEAGAGSTK